MNQEIEIKLEITKDIYQNLLDRFHKDKLPHSEKEQKDVYFSPQASPFFGGDIDNEYLRIRMLKDKNILSYKKIFFGSSDEDIHLEEHETEIMDLDQTIHILKALRIDEVLTLHKIRNTFIYQDIFEIAVDNITDLGYFVEIEILDSSLSIQEANTKLLSVVAELGLDISKRNLDGYAYLLYKKLYLGEK